MVSARVRSAPPAGRSITVEPQRMHSALVPGGRSATSCASPQVSQARIVSPVSAMAFSTVSRRGGFLLYSSPLSGRAYDTCATSCSGPATGRLRLQPAAVLRRAGEGRLGRGGQPVPAARRPDSQPREHGEGLRPAGKGRADRRHRSARKGDLGAGQRQLRGRSRSLPALRPGAARSDRRPLAPARRGGELSAAQVRPEFPRAAGAARRHREPYRRGAAALHQGDAGIQHPRAPVPDQPYRDGLRLQAEAAILGRGRESDRQAAQRRLRHEEMILLYPPDKGGVSRRRTGGLIFLLAALLAAFLAAAADIPPLKARVTDLTGTLSAEQRSALEQTLAEFERRKGAQLAVLMVATTQPEAIEQYAVRVEEAWKLGRKGVDDSILLVIAKNDRKLKIETGYGLEGVVPDAVAKRVIEDDIVPRFKAGDFYGGIRAGMDRLMRLVEGETLPPPAVRTHPNAEGLSLQWLMPLVFFALIGGTILRAIFGRFVGSGVAGGVVGFAA